MSTPIKDKEISKLTYDEAMAQIESTLTKLENECLPIDVILSESRHVVALIAHCRGCIESVGKELDEILKDLEPED